ncbi:MAG: ABC-F family ATP-binding cassette domain-containing protein [Saprospiraceae bacterium]|nr:ABC-F family ATP-binding cassette domain-containing protein [Saprospiraceae bacterium]
MVTVSNISYHVAGRVLYEKASLHIKPRDRIGLVGLNGTGKTTLLRILIGEYTTDEGSISFSKECTIGFLNQDLLSYETDDSILTVAMSAFAEAQSIQRDLEDILVKLETDHSEKLIERMSKLQEKYETLEGYSLQAKAEEILEGIGFRTEDLHRPLREFSGGWRMRVMLAKLLLEKPSLLLMDEPTNHLDLPSIEWVESYLRSYEGAFMVVSHDRQFLNNVSTKTVEVDNYKLSLYEGNYDFFQEEKKLRKEIQQNTYENQQQQIKQTERFITRFRAKSTKARQVQSKIKSLERMDKVEEVVDSQAVVNFKFKFSQKSGRHLMHLDQVSKSFGDIAIFDHTIARIERGDKIALIGANGKGKSTLLRIIDGSEPIQSGKREEGYNLIKAFYAQHQLDALQIENEILDELKQAGSGKSEQELRNILGCFLFSGDDVYKKIKVLSGGEKSRVALAKTLISEANFLLLDEPTNHLDFLSENILIQALQQYEGSFIIVSHNRHFISKTANKVWYIENQEIKEYLGTFDEYEYWKENNKVENIVSSEQPLAKSREKKPAHHRPTNNSNDKLIRKLKAELEKIEVQVMDLEEKVTELEEQLTDPSVYADVEKLMTTNEAYEKAKTELEQANKDWEVKAMECERLEG